MERIKLNLIPSGVAPIVHLSQYDDGRKFGIDLFEGESVYVLDGTETLTVNSRKPDGHVVTLTVTNTGTSSLDVDTVEQLTAVHGVSYAKLQIVKGSVTIATLPFLIDVSRDPLENGDPSGSFIQNLRTQVAEMVAEEVATQYDSSNVIFDNEPTENHGIGYTVTSEGIKTAIDNAFDYDNTASGSLVHITDGADNIPVKSFKCAIGSDGFSQADISVCGKNLFDNLLMVNSKTVVVDDTVTLTATGNFQGSEYAFMPVKQGYKYALKIGSLTNGSAVEVRRYNSAGTVTNTIVITQSTIININDGTTVKISIVYGNRTSGAGTFVLKGFNIALGEVYQPYQAYNGTTYTVSFGSTFNDGVLKYENGEWFIDVSGVITPIISNTRVKTINGENNIFSNCGDAEVNYYTSKSNNILEFINTEIGKKNGTNIPIEENSQDSIKDYIDTGLSGKADTSDLNDKQNKNVLNIVKHYDSGTSSDAITDIITEYGKVNMVFAFDVPLGYFTGCLTFVNDNVGSGFIVLSTTGRFWVVSYVSGTITLTELT